MEGSAPGANSLLGWLPAVVPATARTFRAADQELAETLAEAGGTLDDLAPDVELGTAADLRGDAPYAIVSVDASQPDGGGLALRGVRRIAGSLTARTRALAARRSLRRRGYREVSTVLWDIDYLLFVPGVRDSLRGRPVAAYLPERALVAGSRHGVEPTILEAVAAEASRALGRPLEHGWPLARQAMIVVIADQGVLRVAVGPGRARLEHQRRVLEQLAATAPAGSVASRVPRPLCAGRTGLADWSLDTRLPGREPAALTPQLLDECFAFLVELFGCGERTAPPESLSTPAEVIADACSGDLDAGAVRELALRLDAVLAGVPRGFAHGDFWARNLLTDGNRLTGVVDWDGAGDGRLPLLDLLHLRLSADRERTRQYLGTALVEQLLPWARAGGDPLARDYGERVGVELTPPVLEALVGAYWLDRVAGELAMFSDLARRPLWLRANVDGVISQLAGRPHHP